MPAKSKIFLTLSVWIVLTILAAPSIRLAAADPALGTAKLSPEAKVFVSRTLAFIDKMNGIYFDAATRLNGDANRLEQSELDTDNGHWDTQGARGPVMEKAGRTIDRSQLVRTAWLRTVNRPPTDEEIERAEQHLAKVDSLSEGMRDLLWALINTKEFILNR